MSNASQALQSFHKSDFFQPVKDSIRDLRLIREQVAKGSVDSIFKISDFITAYYTYAIDRFYQDYINNYELPLTSRILLENNVQLPLKDANPLAPGRVSHLIGLCKRHPDLFALCFDEEHAYATGDYSVIPYSNYDVTKSIDFRTELLTAVPNSLYHFNTIPKDVEFGSFKDRHSDTALNEGKIDFTTYHYLINQLDAKGINCIREVNKETMERELPLMESVTNLYGN